MPVLASGRGSHTVRCSYNSDESSSKEVIQGVKPLHSGKLLATLLRSSYLVLIHAFPIILK